MEEPQTLIVVGAGSGIGASVARLFASRGGQVASLHRDSEKANEYAKDGIAINALASAVIQTPFLDTRPDEVISHMIDKIPMGRTGTVHEVAELIGWMISPACRFTTGFAFDLSGGRATY